jgi:CBS domain-containing protein
MTAPMEQHRLRRLPLLSAGGLLVGIVSMNDVVNRAAQSPAADPLWSGVIETLSAIGAHRAAVRVSAVGR